MVAERVDLVIRSIINHKCYASKLCKRVTCKFHSDCGEKVVVIQAKSQAADNVRVRLAYNLHTCENQVMNLKAGFLVI